jgi:cytochrome c oxidase subunit 2
MMRARLLSLFPFAGLALVVLLLPLPVTRAPVTREVTVNASQYEFDPAILHMNQGDRVVLTVKASDVVHGLYLDGYGIDVRVEPGLSQQVVFTADRAGKFRYRCSVGCGTLHPFMIGELVVGPNLPFFRAVGLVVVAVAATLFILWRFPIREPDAKVQEESFE